MSARPRRTAALTERHDLLFGGGGARPPPRPNGDSVQLNAHAEAEGLQDANGRAVDGLRDRVGDMRHLALDIGTEVGEQNVFLEGMSDGFDDARERVRRSIREMERLTRGGAGAFLCTLLAFMFFFFVLVYLLLR